MPEAPEERIGRVTGSPLFPFRADLTVKDLMPEMATELPRDGEGDRPCHACGNADRVLWSNGRWQIAKLPASGNPVMLFLETVEHLDFEHLDAAMAAEFGVLTWQLEAAIRALDSVGRVHIHRWADGSSHFHVWFQGRPARRLEYYGWGNVLWPQVLEPWPADEVDANHRRVIEHFAANVV